MARGSSTKGYKMTENRRRILELLVEEGGAIKSNEGRATGLMHGLLDGDASTAALHAALRALDNIGLIILEVEGRRTYAISITDEGRSAIDAETAPENEATADVPDETQVVQAPDAEPEVALTAPVSAEEWDWDFAGSEGPDGIDYNIVTGVILKAALRGMEGPSLNGELDYYKQQNENLTNRVEALEAEVDKFRAEAAQAIAERDQLQKNLNIIMSKSESRGSRGTDPIRRLLSPEERASLDALMRQIPSTRGE